MAAQIMPTLTGKGFSAVQATVSTAVLGKGEKQTALNTLFAAYLSSVTPHAPEATADIADDLSGDVLPLVDDLLPQELSEDVVETPILNLLPVRAAEVPALATFNSLNKEMLKASALAEAPSLLGTVQKTMGEELASVITDKQPEITPLAARMNLQISKQSMPPVNATNEIISGVDIAAQSVKNNFNSAIMKQHHVFTTAHVMPASEPVILNTAHLMPVAERTESTFQLAPQPTIDTPFSRTGWDQAVGKQIAWMAGQNIQSAELRLNPAHLGPLEVKISMEGEHANIVFSSQHAVVREALENALPRLREAFSEQGLNLGNVDVSEQQLSRRQQQDSFSDADPSKQAQADEPSSDNLLEAGNSATVKSHNGLVDYYI